MASSHIVRTAGSDTAVCQHEEVKASITLAEGADLPRLTMPGSGAPVLCPECVVAHVAGSWATPERKERALFTLTLAILKETKGTRQGLDTELRYAFAVREELQRLGSTCCVPNSATHGHAIH